MLLKALEDALKANSARAVTNQGNKDRAGSVFNPRGKFRVIVTEMGKEQQATGLAHLFAPFHDHEGRKTQSDKRDFWLDFSENYASDRISTSRTSDFLKKMQMTETKMKLTVDAAQDRAKKLNKLKKFFLKKI